MLPFIKIDKICPKMKSDNGEMDKIINLPIVDAQAHQKLTKLQQSAVLHLPNRLIETTDGDITIDPAVNMDIIEKRIIQLSSDEQDEIIRKVKSFKLIHTKLNRLRQQAFGIKKPKYQHTLMMGYLDERASELLEYFGQMKSDEEVHDIVLNKWGIDVAFKTIVAFRKRNQDRIIDLQKAFQANVDDIRLSHKKGRLEELQDLYIDRKQKYKMTEQRSDYQLLLLTLKQIREEVQDSTIRINHTINGRVELVLEHHIQQEILKGMSVMDIIIARAAVKLKINPAFIIARLHNSIYAKNSGMIRPDGDLYDQEIVYPSSIVYNWNDIEQLHSQEGDTDTELAQWEDLTDLQDKASVELIKKQLIDRINDKRANLDSSFNRVEDSLD